MSQGKTKKEALDNAKKAIKAYMETVKKTEKDKNIQRAVVDVPFSFTCA